MAAVDTKRGYVGMCNGRSAQQESGAALSKNSMFTAGLDIANQLHGMALHVQLRQKQRVSEK